MSEKPLSRRSFLRRGALLLAGATPALVAARAPEGPGCRGEPSLRIGLVTDAHCADKAPAGGRDYRAAATRIAEAAEGFREARADLAAELGDWVDGAGDREAELAAIDRVEAAFARFPGERLRVLGNHCVAALRKEEFLGRCRQEKACFSIDREGWRIIVLDACFDRDGVPYGGRSVAWEDTDIPAAGRAWLEEDLARCAGPAVVLVHQRLDAIDGYGIRSAPAVRRILERSGKVRAVLQGHYHAGDHRRIGGIHYVTLKATVEGSGGASAVLECFPDGSLRLAGRGRQPSYDLPVPAPVSRRRF